MRYVKLTRFDVANGPGIRTTLWVSGCIHNCPGCHNPETHDPDYGTLYTPLVTHSIIESLRSSHVAGLTISGGDPLHPNNRVEVMKIASDVKNAYPDKSIWLYTGYKWEDIKNIVDGTIDVVVDGKFILEKKDVTLPYCGSTNQRVIDVAKSMNKKEIVLYSK